MGVHSGRFGVIDGVHTVRNWNLTDQQTTARYVASNTKFGTGRKKGVRSWSGSFAGFGGQPVLLPGDFATFNGYTAPDDDVSGNGECYSGQIYVPTVSITWNWASGELLSWTANFVGHLALTRSTDEFEDLTAPDPEPVCGTKILYPTTQWTNVTQAVLNLQCPNVAYVNSDTIVSGTCWTGQKQGIFDWNLAVTEQNNGRQSALEVGTDVKLRLFIDATTFWRLTWGHVAGYSGLTVDRQTGAIIQQTVNIEKNGFLAGDTGVVQAPDGTVWWGDAPSSSS